MQALSLAGHPSCHQCHYPRLLPALVSFSVSSVGLTWTRCLTAWGVPPYLTHSVPGHHAPGLQAVRGGHRSPQGPSSSLGIPQAVMGRSCLFPGATCSVFLSPAAPGRGESVSRTHPTPPSWWQGWTEEGSPQLVAGPR